jgi:ribosomal protein S18 acetylase RimI-like enzyme
MRITVRPFAGSLADAQGLLAVERATFNECPYDAAHLCAMLTDGPQRIWLALAEDSVVGFAAAFLTGRVDGASWEIDLLAVHPDWEGRGLATRLIRLATIFGADLAPRARAVVATDNLASLRAFRHAGFRPLPGSFNLLIYRSPGGLSTYPLANGGVTIHEAGSPGEAAAWLADALPAHDVPGLTLLLAEQGGQPVGYAELVEAQTILYHGLWIESLTALAQRVRQALVQRAVRQAQAAGLDEIGAMVSQDNWPLQQALLAAGFRSLGDFRWLVAELPLPDLIQQDRV